MRPNTPSATACGRIARWAWASVTAVSRKNTGASGPSSSATRDFTFGTSAAPWANRRPVQA